MVNWEVIKQIRDTIKEFGLTKDGVRWAAFDVTYIVARHPTWSEWEMAGVPLSMVESEKIERTSIY